MARHSVHWATAHVLLLLLPLSVACSLLQLNSKVGAVTITDAYLTSGLDSTGQPLEPAVEFPQDQGRIYCVVTVDSPSPIRVGVRWFYGDELVFDAGNIVDRRGLWYIEPRVGESFELGDYRAEVYLVDAPLRTLDFTIIQQ